MGLEPALGVGGGREIVVPETVMAGPPGVTVWPPTMYTEADDVRVTPPTVIIAGAAGADAAPGSAIVADPMANAVPLGARETRVPEIVTAGAPGKMVWEPTISVEPDITAVAEPLTSGAAEGGVVVGSFGCEPDPGKAGGTTGSGEEGSEGPAGPWGPDGFEGSEGFVGS